MARPNLSYLRSLLLALFGLLVGGWSGLTGMGPAVFASPALQWLIGLRQRRLAAATVVVTIVVALFSLLAYSEAHLLLWVDIILIVVFSTIGAVLASQPWAEALRDTQAALVVWACLTIAAGFWMIDSIARILPIAGGRAVFGSPQSHVGIIAVIVAALAIGLIQRLANLGGALVAPGLFLIGVASRSAEGIALAVLLLVSIAPAFAYLQSKDVPASPSIWVGFGCGLGALIGSRVAMSLDPAKLVVIYGAGLFAIGLARLLTAWRTAPNNGQAPAG